MCSSDLIPLLERGQSLVNEEKNSACSVTKSSAAGFPGGSVVKNPPANAGHMGSSPGPGRSHMPQSN